LSSRRAPITTGTVITRFDHAVIAVRELSAAISQFRRLGFDARPGGRHSGRGTENAIIRFGLDYIELISVYDADEARSSGLGGTALVEYLAQHDGGLVGYCLASERLEEHVEELSRGVPGTVGPLDMQRRRPDDHILRWRLLIPGGNPWLSPYPFFIEWELPDGERLSLETPGQHQLGVTAVEGVTITVPESDLPAVSDLYERVLGLAAGSTPGEFGVGQFAVRLTRGPATGPTELLLAVEDQAAAQALLASQGARYREDVDGLRVGVEETCGASIRLIQG
jgi:Glyoxalase-like domain